MKKEFKLWLPINDGEYFTLIKVKAETVAILKPYRDEEGDMKYPVQVDKATLLFDEPVEEEV